VFVLSVGLSVGLLETSVYFGRMAEATEMPFGVVGWVVPGKTY